MANTFLTMPPTSRVGRYPKHTFNVRSVPFHARPFLIAPVLPAETLQSMYLESRVITDPIKNPIIGWKKEYFFFYVKMSDLLDDTIKEMFIDPQNASLSAEATAADNIWYQPESGGFNWLKRGMDRIMKHYFWDEGEDLTRLGAPKYYQYPVYYRDTGIFDSITDKDDMPQGAAISSATDAQDLEALMTAFEHLRAMGLANMSYEDFLRSYGVNIKDPTEGKPELLWHLSDWQYPSNTINPETGALTSAVSWVFKQSFCERKFFTEPGFVIGLTVTRPKMYMGGQSGYASAFLQRAWDWMPALLASMPETRLKQFAANTGPVVTASPDGDAYWLDMCDLFIHGDQFLDKHDVWDSENNELVADSANHHFAAPYVYDGEVAKRQWPDNVDALFANAGEEPAENIREDGMVSFAIKGKQIDLTETAGFKAGM